MPKTPEQLLKEMVEPMPARKKVVELYRQFFDSPGNTRLGDESKSKSQKEDKRSDAVPIWDYYKDLREDGCTEHYQLMSDGTWQKRLTVYGIESYEQPFSTEWETVRGDPLEGEVVAGIMERTDNFTAMWQKDCRGQLLMTYVEGKVSDKNVQFVIKNPNVQWYPLRQNED